MRWSLRLLGVMAAVGVARASNFSIGAIMPVYLPDGTPVYGQSNVFGHWSPSAQFTCAYALAARQVTQGDSSIVPNMNTLLPGVTINQLTYDSGLVSTPSVAVDRAAGYEWSEAALGVRWVGGALRGLYPLSASRPSCSTGHQRWSRGLPCGASCRRASNHLRSLVDHGVSRDAVGARRASRLLLLGDRPLLLQQGRVPLPRAHHPLDKAGGGAAAQVMLRGRKRRLRFECARSCDGTENEPGHRK